MLSWRKMSIFLLQGGIYQKSKRTLRPFTRRLITTCWGETERAVTREADGEGSKDCSWISGGRIWCFGQASSNQEEVMGWLGFQLWVVSDCPLQLLNWVGYYWPWEFAWHLNQHKEIKQKQLKSGTTGLFYLAPCIISMLCFAHDRPHSSGASGMGKPSFRIAHMLVPSGCVWFVSQSQRQ